MNPTLILTFFGGLSLFVQRTPKQYEDRERLQAASIVEFMLNGGLMVVTSVAFSVYVRLLIDASLHWLDGLVAAIPVVGWPILEFVVHKYQMHHIPGPVFDDHHRHHDHPFDARSGITPIEYTGLVLMIGSLFIWLQTPLLASVMVGVLSMLLFYDWIHYLIHTTHKPLTWWGRKVLTNHRAHHFRDDTRFNGLLFPFHDQD